MSKTEALLEKLVARINAAPSADHGGFLANPTGRSGGMDLVTRESHIRLIRSLARAYRHHGFDLLINQATIGRSSMDQLSDAELIALHDDIDRARECVAEGISFDLAGLIRPRFNQGEL